MVERRVHGVRKAALGTLYDPLYFYRGFAIHGSGSVPAYPASHGCVRVSMADAAWLIERIPDGMPVQLYGGTHVFTPSR
ncbi:MAG: L,D-transpeptidase [Egicoccus sp.]